MYPPPNPTRRPHKPYLHGLPHDAQVRGRSSSSAVPPAILFGSPQDPNGAGGARERDARPFARARGDVGRRFHRVEARRTAKVPRFSRTVGNRLRLSGPAGPQTGPGPRGGRAYARDRTLATSPPARRRELAPSPRLFRESGAPTATTLGTSRPGTDGSSVAPSPPLTLL